MQRRDRIGRGLAAALVGAFAVMVAAAHAQQAPRLIGYLGSGAPESYVEHLAGFRDGLKDAGVVEGRDAAFEFRWAYGDYGKLPSLAADLVRRQVGVIAATGGNPTAFAAKAATSTIPIVFTIGDDPVEIGLVASLSRPGGNVTGASLFFSEMGPKRLELLRELLPNARLVALLVNPGNRSAGPQKGALEAATRVTGQTLVALNAGTEHDVEAAFASAAQQHVDAVFLSDDPFFSNQHAQIIALSARHRMPTIYFQAIMVRAGGLIGYGASPVQMYRQAGDYVGRILKGAKPEDLPVEQPTKFDLAVNLKTAKALGLTVPQSILLRADQIIE